MTIATHTHIPNQDIIFEPYSQKFYSYYDHNDAILKYYISPEFGEFTRLLGENTILEGLTISNVSHTANSVSCTVAKGRMIIDRTYIEIESDDVITYEHANSFADSGYFVLSVRFNNQNILRANKSTYHLTYFTATSLSHSDFDPTENLIILGVFSFANTNSVITSFNLIDFEFGATIILDGVEKTIRNVENSTNILLDGGIINFSDVEISGHNNVFDMVNLLKVFDATVTYTVT